MKNVIISSTDWIQLNRDLGYCIGLLTGVEDRVHPSLKNKVEQGMAEIRARQVPEIIGIA